MNHNRHGHCRLIQFNKGSVGPTGSLPPKAPSIPQPHQKHSLLLCTDRGEKRRHGWPLNHPPGKRGSHPRLWSYSVKKAREQPSKVACCINSVLWQGSTESAGWASSPGKWVALNTIERLIKFSALPEPPQNTYRTCTSISLHSFHMWWVFLPK